MTGGRFLILLIVSAAALLAAALAISAGDGTRVATAAAASGAGEPGWMTGAIALARAFTPSSGNEISTLLTGFLAGWVLRWIYSLPWRAVPRAVADWLLGWRTSAAMVGLAVGCTVILLFY